MGCDGGTIPKRDELVKTKKRPEQKDKTSELSFRWQHCALTQQPLIPPVVICELGRLYSKEKLIEALLDKSEENGLKEVAPHIKSLKDIKELKLTDNPSWVDLVRGENGDSYIDVQKAKWICPIAGIEMNGRFRFCALWTCGCVFSEKALKEMVKVKEEGNECPNCQKPFQIVDIITLNPSEDKDFLILREKMSLRRALAKEAKEAKKSGKKRQAATATATATSEEVEPKVKVRGSEVKKDKEESSAKKPKINAPIPVSAAAASSNSKYSVAQDPKASEVYKSLFTTHETAANQTKAHWVTYNPFYN